MIPENEETKKSPFAAFAALPKGKRITILSVAAAVLLIAAAVITLAACGVFGGDDEEPVTDAGKLYRSLGLDDYVQLPASLYSGASFSYTAVDEVTDEYVEKYIKSQILPYVTATAIEGGDIVQDGDKVEIFYRGQVDGKDFVGGCNYADTSAYALLIGSGSFIDGFESALIGKDTGSYSLNFATADSRTVLETDRVVLTFTYADKDNKEKTGKGSLLVDLNDPAGLISSDLVNAIVGQNVGATITDVPEGYEGKYDYDSDLEWEDVKLSGVKVLKVLTAENPLEIHVTFPADYGVTTQNPEGAAVKGKDATFFVSFKAISRPKITASFLSENFGLNATNMDEFIKQLDNAGGMSEDEKIVAAFPVYLKKVMNDDRDNTVYSNKATALWTAVFAAGALKKDLPDAVIKNEYDALYEIGEEYHAYLQTQSPTYTGTKEQSMRTYYAIEDGTSLEDGLTALAKDEAKNYAIFYYIAEKFGVEVSDKEYEDDLAAGVAYYKAQGYTYTKDDILEANGGAESYRFNLLYQKLTRKLVEDAQNTFTPAAAE